MDRDELHTTLGKLTTEIDNIKSDIIPLQKDMGLLNKEIAQATFKLSSIADSVIKLVDRQASCTLSNVEKNVEFDSIKKELRENIRILNKQYDEVNRIVKKLDSRLLKIESVEDRREYNKDQTFNYIRIAPALIGIGVVILGALAMYLNK